MMQSFSCTISEKEEGVRVDLFLSQILEETRSFIKDNAPFIFVNKTLVKLSYKLKRGDEISFNYKEITPVTRVLTAQKIDLDILFEDEDILVINKPPGMVVHPSKGNWDGTLANALAYHLKLEESLELRPGIVHRLDKDTSGLMVVAKKRKAQATLMEAFKQRRVIKIYECLVGGHLPFSYGKIENYIARDPKNKMLFKVSPTKEGKYALSEYQVMEEFSKATYVKVRIHTGRTHQIRVHFKHLGTPIMGDSFYGSLYKKVPLCLAATKIIFEHPIKKEKMRFSIPLPSHIQKQIELFSQK
jgi:23S rRNA pseudouridine1911/1915/1917 synthase